MTRLRIIFIHWLSLTFAVTITFIWGKKIRLWFTNQISKVRISFKKVKSKLHIEHIKCLWKLNDQFTYNSVNVTLELYKDGKLYLNTSN
jgi:hypothetical protein